MAGDDRVDLGRERQYIDSAWQELGQSFAPLPVAAAIAFHQAHRNTHAIVSRRDYDDALNIAAAALARLVTVYRVLDPREGRVPVSIEPGKHRFARGATELRCPDGSILRDLMIQRSELISALSLIKRAGLPFSFAALPADAPEPAPASDRSKKPAL